MDHVEAPGVPTALTLGPGYHPSLSSPEDNSTASGGRARAIHHFVTAAIVLVALILGGPAFAAGQDEPLPVHDSLRDTTEAASGRDDQPTPPPTPRHTGPGALLRGVAADFAHLPSRENLGWALFGGSLAAIAYPFDQQVNQHLAGTVPFFGPGKIIGLGYVQVGAALTTYVYGRASHRNRVSHVGMDLLRAQIVAGTLTYGLKYAVRRERPDGSDNLSFPSGHAAVTFATALVLQRHFGWWSLPTFLVASYTATSRLHENVHYLSDVIAGATVGAIAGRTVTRHGRNSYALVPLIGRGTFAIVLQRRPSGG